VTAEEIAADAIWGSRDEDDVRSHIEAAIDAAVRAERRRIADRHDDDERR